MQPKEMVAMLVQMICVAMIANVASGETVNVTDEETYFHSPNYDFGQNYPPFTTVEYRFQSASIGHALTLTIVEFILEDPETNCYDSLSIYDGNDISSNLLVQLCGIVPPGTTYTTSGSTVYALFNSNGVNQYKGFNVSVASSGQETNTTASTSIGTTTGSVTSSNTGTTSLSTPTSITTTSESFTASTLSSSSISSLTTSSVSIKSTSTSTSPQTSSPHLTSLTSSGMSTTKSSDTANPTTTNSLMPSSETTTLQTISSTLDGSSSKSTLTAVETTSTAPNMPSSTSSIETITTASSYSTTGTEESTFGTTIFEGLEKTSSSVSAGVIAGSVISGVVVIVVIIGSILWFCKKANMSKTAHLDKDVPGNRRLKVQEDI